MQYTTRYVVSFFALILCLGLLLTGSVPQVNSGSWVSAGNMLQPRTGAASVQLQDGRILIIGGTGNDGVLSSAEIYDHNGNFSSTAPMDFPRTHHSAVVLKDGRVLVTGGMTAGDGITNAVEIYDPSNNSWSSLAGGMLEARTGH